MLAAFAMALSQRRRILGGYLPTRRLDVVLAHQLGWSAARMRRVCDPRAPFDSGTGALYSLHTMLDRYRRLVADHLVIRDIHGSVASRTGLSLAELERVLTLGQPMLEVRGVGLVEVANTAGMVWAVRHDYSQPADGEPRLPHHGSHRFTTGGPTVAAAWRVLQRDDRYWNRSRMPVPRALSVVPVDPAFLRAHQPIDDCTDLTCPTVTDQDG